jgi:hypothetical protein
MAPGIKKGPVTGPWGFTGYGSPGSGLISVIALKAVLDSRKRRRRSAGHEGSLGPCKRPERSSDRQSLSAGRRRPLWLEVGATFVAVDTLVHNFLHRTGILRRLCADHPYGDRCYRPGGCASILGLLAGQHRCSRVQPDLPQDVSTVRAERDLAVLRRERSRRLNRQSDRRLPRVVTPASRAQRDAIRSTTAHYHWRQQ